MPDSAAGRAHEREMLRELIESRAKLFDSEVHATLMNNLVLRYSEAERRLRELNEIKNRFLGMAAHDLRNPLAAIIGMSEMLVLGDLGPVPEEHREFLEMIHESGRQMLTLVNDLLDVSVIESGNLQILRTPGSLKALIEKRLRLSLPLAQKKSMTVDLQCREIPEFSFDHDKISQVFDNYFTNAVKFSPVGSTIRIALSVEDGEAMVAVTDEGPGLSLEDQAKLFGTFQRLTARPTGGEKSTGLGLAIVRRMVEGHGGRVGVNSTLGAGSTFFFLLPMGESE